MKKKAELRPPPLPPRNPSVANSILGCVGTPASQRSFTNWSEMYVTMSQSPLGTPGAPLWDEDLEAHIMVPKIGTFGDPNSPSPPSSPESPAVPADTSIPFSIWVLFWVSLFSQWGMAIINFITFFILQARGWASDDDDTFYGLSFAVNTFVPVLAGPALGLLSQQNAVQHVILAAHVISVFGVLLICSADSKYVYLFGTFLASWQSSLRPLRTSYIGNVCPVVTRTRAMAYLTGFTELAWLLGAFSFKVCSMLAPEPGQTVVVYGWLMLDQLYLCLYLCLGLQAFNILVLLFIFKDETPKLLREARLYRRQSAVSNPEKAALLRSGPNWSETVEIIEPTGNKRTINIKHYPLIMTAYVGAMFFMFQVSTGIHYVSEIPALTHILHLPQAESQTKVADMRILADIVRLPIPLVVGMLTRKLQDRSLMIIGIMVALLASVVFALPPAMCRWQPIGGIIILASSKSFFYVTLFSSFSKLLGVRATHAKVGLVSSLASLGQALGAAIGGAIVGKWYHSWMFIATSSPGFLMAGLLFLHPWFFTRVGSSNYVTPQIVEAYAQDLARRRESISSMAKEERLRGIE